MSTAENGAAAGISPYIKVTVLIYIRDSHPASIVRWASCTPGKAPTHYETGKPGSVTTATLDKVVKGVLAICDEILGETLSVEKASQQLLAYLGGAGMNGFTGAKIAVEKTGE